MRSDHHRADNLLLRLFSDTPRLGRLPLEDFCTRSVGLVPSQLSLVPNGFSPKAQSEAER